tara:strand:- start:50088 stop:50507 length:420 start_codon:yes stop_codon:yes gene_type:complete
MGNLTRDPELRTSKTGTAVCTFTLAVSRTFKGQDGSQREETAFVDVTAFGRQGEVISQYCSKGKPLFVEGRLRLDQWETNNGEKRSKLGVTLESFQFVGARGDNNSAGGTQYEQSAPPARAQAPVAAGHAESIDDDVPF